MVAKIVPKENLPLEIGREQCQPANCLFEVRLPLVPYR